MTSVERCNIELAQWCNDHLFDLVQTRITSYNVCYTKLLRPLSQFNIAPFYGCHNIRPSELQNETHKSPESAYKPTSLDDLIVACGGVNVDYEEKNKCCGFHAELQAPRTAAVLTGNAVAGAMDANADWMVTPCPLCHLKLDTQTHHSYNFV